MAAADVAAIADMARELAAALDDPEPVLDPGDLAIWRGASRQLAAANEE